MTRRKRKASTPLSYFKCPPKPSSGFDGPCSFYVQDQNPSECPKFLKYLHDQPLYKYTFDPCAFGQSEHNADYHNISAVQSFQNCGSVDHIDSRCILCADQTEKGKLVQEFNVVQDEDAELYNFIVNNIPAIPTCIPHDDGFHYHSRGKNITAEKDSCGTALFGAVGKGGSLLVTPERVTTILNVAEMSSSAEAWDVVTVLLYCIARRIKQQCSRNLPQPVLTQHEPSEINVGASSPELLCDDAPENNAFFLLNASAQDLYGLCRRVLNCVVSLCKRLGFSAEELAQMVFSASPQKSSSSATAAWRFCVNLWITVACILDAIISSMDTSSSGILQQVSLA